MILSYIHTTKGGIGSKPWSIHQELVPLSAGYMIVEERKEKKEKGEKSLFAIPLLYHPPTPQ